MIPIKAHISGGNLIHIQKIEEIIRYFKESDKHNLEIAQVLNVYQYLLSGMIEWYCTKILDQS